MKELYVILQTKNFHMFFIMIYNLSIIAMPGLIPSIHLILLNDKNLGNKITIIVCREYIAYNPQELILSDSNTIWLNIMKYSLPENSRVSIWLEGLQPENILKAVECLIC